MSLGPILISFSRDTLSHFTPVTPQVAPVIPLEDMLPVAAVGAGVMELLDAATQGRNLCRMEPTWHPWL